MARPSPRRSAPPPPSAILPDGRLNVDLLQREVASDVASDAKYRAEDGMKKRAVNSSKDYGEFRNLVLASQLKPVNRTEMSELFNPLASSTNGMKRGPGAANKSYSGVSKGGSAGVIGGKIGSASAEKNASKRGSKKKTTVTPSSSCNKAPIQFEREWRNRCTDPASTVRYLLTAVPDSDPSAIEDAIGDSGGEGLIGGALAQQRRRKRRLALSPEEAPRTVFRVEIDANVMGDIIAAMLHVSQLSSPVPTREDGSLDEQVDVVLSTLAEFSSDDDNEEDDSSAMLRVRAQFVYRWMDCMTKCGRFGLNVCFLSGTQKGAVESVCSFLEQHCCDGIAFGVYRNDDVIRLRDAYLQ